MLRFSGFYFGCTAAWGFEICEMGAVRSRGVFGDIVLSKRKNVVATKTGVLV